MRAVVLHEYGGPEQLEFEDDAPIPQLTGDTVIVASAATSVNPIDWKIRSGARQKDFPLTLPAILGRDVSGIIHAVGDNVRNFKGGERVFALANSTYAQFVAVDASALAHLPDGVDLIDAAALPLISMTGDQLVRIAANVEKGQRILVTGALGSVGRAAVHTAKKLGAQVVAAVRKTQTQEAASLGVADILAMDDEEAVNRLTPVDAIADTVGGKSVLHLLTKIKPGGNFGHTSVLPEGAASMNVAINIQRVFAKPDPSKLREFADDVRDGKFTLPINRRMILRDASEAHRLAKAGGAGKIVLTIQQ
jgi:NADPH:quinone reductase-like Zn-dependent oxidoreductase